MFKSSQQFTDLLPANVLIGISIQGVTLMDKAKRELEHFYIEAILRWGYRPSSFYFELEDDKQYGTATLEFDANESTEISDLLTEYAMGYLKENEQKATRAQMLKDGVYDRIVYNHQNEPNFDQQTGMTSEKKEGQRRESAINKYRRQSLKMKVLNTMLSHSLFKSFCLVLFYSYFISILE